MFDVLNECRSNDGTTKKANTVTHQNCIGVALNYLNHCFCLSVFVFWNVVVFLLLSLYINLCRPGLNKIRQIAQKRGFGALKKIDVYT